MVLQRLFRNGAAPDGDRGNGGDHNPHGHRRGRHPQHCRDPSSPSRARTRAADLHGKEAALDFTSGYVSNETGIATIAKLLGSNTNHSWCALATSKSAGAPLGPTTSKYSKMRVAVFAPIPGMSLITRKPGAT